MVVSRGLMCAESCCSLDQEPKSGIPNRHSLSLWGLYKLAASVGENVNTKGESFDNPIVNGVREMVFLLAIKVASTTSSQEVCSGPAQVHVGGWGWLM
jgi:hypothetical protein